MAQGSMTQNRKAAMSLFILCVFAPWRLCVELSFLSVKSVVVFWLRLAAPRLGEFASNFFPTRSNLTKLVRIMMPSNSVFLSLLRLFAANLHKSLAINNLQQIWGVFQSSPIKPNQGKSCLIALFPHP
jgi:hypothetical protein